MSTRNAIVGIIFAIILILIFTISSSKKYSIHLFSLKLISPFINSGHKVKKNFQNKSNKNVDVNQLIDENEQLKQNNDRFKLKLQNYNELVEENDKLRVTLNFIQNAKLKYVASEVILRNTSTWWNTITVNKGKKHGVKQGNPVVTTQGLIGKVISTSDLISKIILITDNRCKVTARVNGTRETGILSGMRLLDNKQPMLVLRYLSKNAKIENGNLVFSQGIATFPEKIALGKILSVLRGNVYTEAFILPFEDFDKLDTVFIIVSEN